MDGCEPQEGGEQNARDQDESRFSARDALHMAAAAVLTWRSVTFEVLWHVRIPPNCRKAATASLCFPQRRRTTIVG